jgi:hypothetical protein
MLVTDEMPFGRWFAPHPWSRGFPLLGRLEGDTMRLTLAVHGMAGKGLGP